MSPSGTLTGVYHELYEEVKEIPLVDIHEHLNPAKLSHSSFEDVLFYHYIVTELASAGMDRGEFEKRRGLDRLLYALPYFKYVRNTATFWCLKQMLRDLYGLDVRAIDEGNWKSVVEALNGAANDEKRALDVLTKKCRVVKSFLTLVPFAEVGEYSRDVFTGVLRLDSLVSYLSKDSLVNLEKATGFDTATPEGLSGAVEALFKKYEKDIVAVALSPLPSEIYTTAAPSELPLYLRELKSRGFIEQRAKALVSSYILQSFLELCRERRKAFQFMLGVQRPVSGAAPPDYAVTHVNYEQLMNLAGVFALYPEVKFDIIIADARLLHPTTVIAKNYPNVYVSGYWWYSMYQAVIREYLKLRLQMLPYNKAGGFFSDAYVADWVYGKSALIRRQTAHVLAEMVSEGYMDMDLAVEVAKALLHENAKRVYGLA
jgi:glucuronate isomerase